MIRIVELPVAALALVENIYGIKKCVTIKYLCKQSTRKRRFDLVKPKNVVSEFRAAKLTALHIDPQYKLSKDIEKLL